MSMALLKDQSIEKLSNIAVIVVAVVVIFSFLRHDFGASKKQNLAFNASDVRLASITATPAKLNVVLGISTTCRFCEKNIGLYKQLSSLETPGKVAFYTIFPESRKEANSFLEQKGIRPNGVISSPLFDYSITGTPTLLLVSPTGKVEKSWVGALDSTRQAEVLQQISQNN
jgi:thioredoxin-related protein